MSAGFVYVLSAPNGLCRIGQTNGDMCPRNSSGHSFKKRIGLICGASPVPLELVVTIWSDSSFELEQALHYIFRDKRRHADWFSISICDIINSIAECIQNLKDKMKWQNDVLEWVKGNRGRIADIDPIKFNYVLTTAIKDMTFNTFNLAFPHYLAAIEQQAA